MAAEYLPVWTVYDHPSDYPGHFVARRRLVGGDSVAQEEAEGVFLLVAETLERLRELIPPGLARLDRSLDDDPVIVESWL